MDQQIRRAVISLAEFTCLCTQRFALLGPGLAQQVQVQRYIMLHRLSTSEDPTLTSLFVRAKQDEEMTKLHDDLDIPDNLLASGRVSLKF